MIQNDPLSVRSKEPYLLILQRFADVIELAYKRKIDCKIKTQTLEGIKFWILTVQPYGRTSGVFELLQVRSPLGLSQSAIETFHLSGDLQLCKIGSDTEFSGVIERIFQHPRTDEVLRLIAEEAIAEETNDEGLNERLFLISEQPFIHGEKEMAQVSILGVGGFLSTATLQELAQEPNISGSAYQEWNGDFVATFRFEGTVKMTLTRKETILLQKIARRALSNAKKNV